MRNDVGLLLDIVMAAKDAQGFIEGLDWEGFNASRLHQNAVIRSLEVVGEASGRVSKHFRDEHPKVAWNEMIGMRHRLIHAYGDVRLDIVWDVAKNKLQTLVEELEPLVPPPGQDGLDATEPP